MSPGYKTPGTTKIPSLSQPGYCNTEGVAAILSLRVETPLSPPGQKHVGVVSTTLQWALKNLVAEPAVARREAVLGETSYTNPFPKKGGTLSKM